MDVITASEFKAKCLGIMDSVAQSGRTVVITKNGKPVAELRPHQPPGGNPFGIWAGKVEITGDIIAASALAWKATLVTADERLLAFTHALPRQDARL